jgi:GntR family transcriptional regulator
MTATLIKRKHVSKSENICNAIKAGITSGKYVKQLPGVTVLAKELGVNPLTVNKAFEMLENHGLVERVSRKGTFIKGKKRIGLVIYKTGTPDKTEHEIPSMLGGVIEGMHEGITELSYTMLSHTLCDSDTKGIEQVLDEVDGLVVFSTKREQDDFAAFKDIPWIKIMGTVDDPNDANHVTYDNDEIGVMAAEHLMNKNCERFYYFGGLNKLFSPRYEKFCSTLSKHNKKGDIIELDYAKLELDVLAPLAKQRLEEIFSRNCPRTGLFLSSSSYVTLTYQLLYSMGIIPMTDVEIITCENIRPVLDGILPQPAVIDLRMKEIGKRGVEMLIDLTRTSQKNDSYAKTIFTTNLIKTLIKRRPEKH